MPHFCCSTSPWTPQLECLLTLTLTPNKHCMGWLRLNIASKVEEAPVHEMKP